jgi:tail collar domain
MTFSTTLMAVICGLATAGAAGVAGAQTPRFDVGEVRMMAITGGNRNAVDALHREGWLEARGQLLSIERFPELYQALGRTWTSESTAQGDFAVPALKDRSQAQSSRNPFGVLGPGDLITSGRSKSDARSFPLSYWIFTGRPVAGADAVGTPHP